MTIRFRSGFTLVEVTLVIGIMAILTGIASLNLSNIQPSADLHKTADLIITDLKQQQLNAMLGQTEGRSAGSDYGIYFAPTKYTLFHGSSYVATDPSNFDVALDGSQVSSSFSGSVIIFSHLSGEIKNFQPGKNTITIGSVSLGTNQTITLNQYGVIEQ